MYITTYYCTYYYYICIYGVPSWLEVTLQVLFLCTCMYCMYAICVDKKCSTGTSYVSYMYLLCTVSAWAKRVFGANSWGPEGSVALRYRTKYISKYSNTYQKKLPRNSKDMCVRTIELQLSIIYYMASFPSTR
ncbi:hypothetical protein L211DRAFT_508274 [Terfezia boudieri ATCC MYA-4762]|uniref:Uncharacterized protein n=1 Tax=Terfezia boudieri ATCC MYA-4762 TaxID=1051890 RepID=A0A3N4LCZ8_9PEZI|nr:hypothetical protein L211DRAFT_508274 [Terfezia boudieri ATCC MYA-4762]